MIDGVTNAGSIATLERTLQFSGARHRLIAHNIANLSTPNFRPVDVSPAEFQAAMQRAVEERNDHAAPSSEPLRPESTGSITFEEDGVRLHPEAIGDNVLFHDGNDRNVERIMQDLVENFMVFRQASELLRSRFALLNTAISQRV